MGAEEQKEREGEDDEKEKVRNGSNKSTGNKKLVLFKESMNKWKSEKYMR